jgi:hypothetical protein
LQQKGASSSLVCKNLNRNPEFNTTNQETYQHWFECFNLPIFYVFASNHKSHESGIKYNENLETSINEIAKKTSHEHFEINTFENLNATKKS